MVHELMAIIETSEYPVHSSILFSGLSNQTEIVVSNLKENAVWQSYNSLSAQADVT